MRKFNIMDAVGPGLPSIPQADEPLPMQAGDRAYWNRIPRGGYCYPQKIPVQIVDCSGERVKIKVAKLNGEIVIRHVRRGHLQQRMTAFADLGEQ